MLAFVCQIREAGSGCLQPGVEKDPEAERHHNAAMDY